MSSSTIRKAIGVVKDQTSISIAKVAGNVAPDLEVLIVKATNHDNEPAEEKYIREILHLISQSRCYVGACVYNISKRLSKTHDWVVALKALMLVHRLLVDGDPVFGQEIMYASRKGARVLNMTDFRVEALSNYWDHSGFVKSYGMYLDQKVEFIAFERKISHKSKSYGDLYESVTKVAMTPVREMKPDRVLERLNKLVRLMDRVLSCRPAGSAKSSKMVLVALYLVLKESFRIYADICEALGVLFDRFTTMEYGNCVKTFDQYVNAAKTIDELVDFYSWSKQLGVARAAEFPDVQKVTDKVLGTLEQLLREKKIQIKKNIEEGDKENGPLPLVGLTQPSNNLLDLEDETAPPVTNGNTLALALLSGPKTVSESGKSDWELALVESTSNVTKLMATNTISTGLDPLMLNGIYDQGAVTSSHTSYNQVSAGPVLALPAPHKNVVDPQDPFAASLMVPPPPYVQLADLEKKQKFAVQGHQVWQTYAMQGQGPPGKINAGIAATYNGMGQQAGYNYAHY